MTAQIWDSESYAKNARFVTELGAPALELLAPRPGERILDVGCGDGVERRDYLECVSRRVRPTLCDANANWTADYVRLRFEAHLTR